MNNNILEIFDDLFKNLDKEDSTLNKQSQSEFNKDLNNLLDEAAIKDGYNSYKDLLESKINTKSFSHQYILNAISSLDYSKYSEEYTKSHKATLDKYLKKLDSSNIDDLIIECYQEIKKLNHITSDEDKGYRDGIRLFAIIAQDLKVDGMNEVSNKIRDML